MKILLSLLGAAGIISTASMPIINNSNESPYLSTINQEVSSVTSIERTGSSGVGINSDNLSLKNLKELDPTITYTDLLNNEIILQIDGEINLLTSIDQKNIKSNWFKNWKNKWSYYCKFWRFNCKCYNWCKPISKS